VDDSPSVRRVATNLIAGRGWTATAVRDGLEALEHLERSTTLPDAVLVDVEMPRMDGYELLAALKAEPKYRDIPVVLVTSRAGEKARRRGLGAGGGGVGGQAIPGAGPANSGGAAGRGGEGPGRRSSSRHDASSRPA